jgi:uncharacterized protein YyaL (SSP411 family)
MTVSGRLVHSTRHGKGRAPATASDYANMIWAALRLYQATGEPDDLAQAIRWVDVLDTHYWAEGSGGYFTAADDTGDVIVRLKSASDDATPSANSMMVGNLAALGTVTGDTRFVQRAEMIVQAFSPELARNLAGHTGLLAASIDLLSPQLIVLVEGEEALGVGLHSTVNKLSVPGAVELSVKGTIGQIGPAALRGKSTDGGRSTAYVCTGPQCSLPVTSGDELRRLVLDQRSVV